MYETYFGYELDCELKCTDLELNLYELNHKEFLKVSIIPSKNSYFLEDKVKLKNYFNAYLICILNKHDFTTFYYF